MTRYLIQLLKERRNEGGLPLVLIGNRAGVRESNMSRFERGGHYYFERLDKIVQSYADALGVDSLDLWDEALTRAREEAGPVSRAGRE